ncbi:MAG: hypothetical protein IJ326_01740 [Lachnospiraceae bacterium]|nr:hypothetical protein [Lachnospiraceae bacterium]
MLKNGWFRILEKVGVMDEVVFWVKNEHAFLKTPFNKNLQSVNKEQVHVKNKKVLTRYLKTQ